MYTVAHGSRQCYYFHLVPLRRKYWITNESIFSIINYFNVKRKHIVYNGISTIVADLYRKYRPSVLHSALIHIRSISAVFFFLRTLIERSQSLFAIKIVEIGKHCARIGANHLTPVTYLPRISLHWNTNTVCVHSAKEMTHTLSLYQQHWQSAQKKSLEEKVKFIYNNREPLTFFFCFSSLLHMRGCSKLQVCLDFYLIIFHSRLLLQFRLFFPFHYLHVTRCTHKTQQSDGNYLLEFRIYLNSRTKWLFVCDERRWDLHLIRTRKFIWQCVVCV